MLLGRLRFTSTQRGLTDLAEKASLPVNLVVCWLVALVPGRFKASFTRCGTMESILLQRRYEVRPSIGSYLYIYFVFAVHCNGIANALVVLQSGALSSVVLGG